MIILDACDIEEYFKIFESFMIHASSRNGHTVPEVSGFHPERLDWAMNLVEGYRGVSAGDLNRLAEKYLKPGEEAVIKILPKAEK